MKMNETLVQHLADTRVFLLVLLNIFHLLKGRRVAIQK